MNYIFLKAAALFLLSETKTSKTFLLIEINLQITIQYTIKYHK